MNISKKYLEALKEINDWVIVSDWAKKVGELYPDILLKAEQEAVNQATETTGLREIAARISSAIVRGAYQDAIEIDTSERPRKVRYIPGEERVQHEAEEIEEDVEPLKRDDIIKEANQSMETYDSYRVNEFETISKQLKTFYGLNFEVDHAKALLNPTDPGPHHPDNFHLILKAHNTKKHNKNWDRFTLDEQIEYIQTAIKLQSIVASRLEVDLEEQVLDSLLQRLRNIY